MNFTTSITMPDQLNALTKNRNRIEMIGSRVIVLSRIAKWVPRLPKTFFVNSNDIVCRSGHPYGVIVTVYLMRIAHREIGDKFVHHIEVIVKD